MCARKLPHATKTASNLSSSAQPPTAPRHTDTNDDVNRFVKWSAVYSTFSSKALCFQIAVAINSVLAFAWTNLLSLPAFSRSATVLFIGALSMLTLDSRTRTQFMCVLSLGVPLGDVWDAINLTPSDLSARLKRVQAAPQVLTFMGTLAGVWIGSRLDKDISFGRKLFFILLQLGIHMCSHLTRMLRTGEEGHLLVPMLCYHFPGLVVFIVVLRQARQPRASAGSDFMGWDQMVGVLANTRLLNTLQQARGPAISKPPPVYQTLDRLIDVDAVWEALDDADLEHGTPPPEGVLDEQAHFFTTGAPILADSDLAKVLAGKGSESTVAWSPPMSSSSIVRIESIVADALVAQGGTAFLVPPLAKVALRGFTPPGKWEVDGHVMHTLLITVHVMHAADNLLCISVI